MGCMDIYKSSNDEHPYNVHYWFVKNNPANAAYKTQADIEKLPEAEREQYLLPEEKRVLPIFRFKGVKESGANPDYPYNKEVLGASDISIPE